MKKNILFIAVCSILFISSCIKENEPIKGHDESITELTVYNNLSEKITDDNINQIAKLTINGIISGEDWNILFEMAQSGSLEVLDMTNAKIIGIDNLNIWNDDEIPEYNFSGSKTLKEVFLPNTLKVIGTEAFAKCRNLTKVHFSDNIDSIAPRAFYESGISGEFDIPLNLKVVGKQAFAKTKITKVIISSNVHAAEDNIIYTLNGNSAFAECEQLTEVVVKDGCSMLELGFQNCAMLTHVTLPNSLKQIGYMSKSTGNYIFYGCSGLKSITLPNNLWFIGYNAFAHTSLTSVNIPDNVQYLCTYAFRDCKSLEKVIMPASLIKIEQGCFQGCEMLHDIVIPENTSEIGPFAFNSCSSLESVTFGENVSSIGMEAFSNCTSLKHIILPLELKKLGSSAFEGCSALSKIIMPNKLKEIESTTFKDCIKLQDVIIGEAITVIGSSSFFHCPKLTELTLPEAVNTIDNYAFSYSGLKELTVAWQYPLQIENNVFDGVNLTKSVLKVPIGTKHLYEASSVWQYFGNIEEQF